MEFCDLGMHCSLKECNRQDYLPFQCKYCKKFYCLEHRFPFKHYCSELEKTKNKIPIPTRKTKNYCVVCKKDTKIEMKCVMCQKNTCLVHRHYHTCIRRLEKKESFFSKLCCWY